MRKGSAFLLAAVSILGMSACTVTATGPRVVVHTPELVVTDVVVARPPPPVRVERVPPPPSGGPAELFVWQPGHWHWDGHDYHWQRGHYERRPAREASWVPPEWVARDGQWVFKPGHWVYH